MSGYGDSKTPRDSRLNPRACTCLPSGVKGRSIAAEQRRGHGPGAQAGAGEEPFPHEAGAPWPRPRQRPLAEGRPHSRFVSRSQTPRKRIGILISRLPPQEFHWSTPGALRRKVKIVIPLELFLRFGSHSFVAAAMKNSDEVF